MWAYLQFALFLLYFKYIIFLGFQYPLLFLTFHLLLVRILLQLRSYILTCNTKHTYKRHSRHRQLQQTTNEKDASSRLSPQTPHATSHSSYLLTVSAASTTALSLACFLLAIPRIRSSAFVYMLLPLYSAFQYTFTSSTPITSTTLLAFTACIVSACIILLNETNIDVTAVVLLLESALFWTARCLFKRDHAGAFRQVEEVVTTGVIIVGVLAVKFEDVGVAVVEIGGVEGWMLVVHFVVNILLSFGVAGIYIATNDDGDEEAMEGEEKELGLLSSLESSNDAGKFALRTALEGVLLLSAGRLYPSYISLPQVMAFAILRGFVYQLQPKTSKRNITIADGEEEEEVQEYTVIIDVETAQLSTTTTSSTRRSRNGRSMATASWLVLPVLVVVLMRVQFHLWLTDPLSHPSPAILDSSDDSGSSSSSSRQPLEIIIAAHNGQTSEHIRGFISDVQSLDVFAGSNPDVTVYTSSGFDTFGGGNLTVELMRENSGLRVNVVTDEIAATQSAQSAYLDYILNNWDVLPTQVLFTIISKDTRDREVLLYRLRRYFTPDRTGFLSLSDSSSTSTCRCQSCSDYRTGFRLEGAEEFVRAVSPEGECGGYDTIPLMDGEGGFVASGRRIRGVGKVVYEGLRRHLQGGSVGGEETVGKMWGVVMRCTDERMAAMCPGVPKFGGFLGEQEVRRLDECQCLDF